jgi:hypothetical protein
MKKIYVLLLLFLCSLILYADKEAPYNFDHGRRELIGYLPDITLRPHVPKTLYAKYDYQKIDSTMGFFDVFAKATVPGFYIKQSYGAPPGTPEFPPFTWAQVGGSGGVRHFSFHFDGNASNNTVGSITIGSKNCEFCDSPTYRFLASANVYVSYSNPPTWFTIKGSATNIVDNKLILDHVYLNNNVNAILFASPALDNNSSVYDDHPYSLKYNPNTRKWAIQHDDLAPMLPGITFHIRIDPSGKTLTAKAGSNILFSSVFLRDDNADKNPYAVIFATPVDNGVKNPHPIAVRYIEPYWSVWNTDGTAMPDGAAFNVRVIGYSQYVSQSSGNTGSSAYSKGAAVDIDGASRTVADTRFLSYSWLNEKPNTQVIITANWNPLNHTGVTNKKYTGVRYDRTRRK